MDGETPLYLSPAACAARDEVERAIQKYVNITRAGEDPIITAWVVGLEWTNINLEQDGRAGRDLIMPLGGTISSAQGLGLWISRDE